MTVPARRPVTAGLKALIESGTGRPCRVATAPEDEVGNTEDVPYAVLWPSTGMFSGPGFVAPEADAVFQYTVHSVGMRDDQADFLADAVREVIVGRQENGSFLYPLTVNGLTVMNRSIAQSAGPMDLNGSVFTVAESYLIAVTSS